MSKQVVRACLTALAVFVTGLLVYKSIPTSLDAFWQPALQAILAGLSALGINVATRGR